MNYYEDYQHPVIDEHPPETGAYNRASTIVVTSVAVVAFAGLGIHVATEGNSSYKPLITPESCIDYGHAYAEHPTDWSGLAAQMYEDRGYIMTPYQLANLNSPLAEFTDTVLSSKLHLDGPACIALPAPQTWGVNITDGKKSVEAYNSSAIDTPEELVAWNPGIAIRNKAGKLDAAATLRQILPAGFVLKTKAKPSLSLFKQEMTQEYFDQVYKKDTALGRKIRAENDADVGIKKGALLNLPPKTTPYLKEHKMTPAGIATYYARSYDADNLGAQQLAGPVEIKLVDEKIAKTEHAVQAMTPDMNLQVLQLQSYAEVRVGHDVPAQWIRWAIESANKYNKNHPELTPAVLIAQMIRESNLTQNPLGGPNFAGAAGISQFLEPTFEEVARERHFPKGVTRYMPQWAIEAQAAYDLDMLVRTKPYVGRNSNIELALAAYNAGPGKVDQYHGMPPASEVGDYPSDILNHANAAMHGYGPLHLTHNNRQTTTGQTITDYVDNIVYWSQTDSRFNTFTVHAKDGNTNTMGWVGCGPTTAAMMASTLTGRQIDPIDMANYFMAKGFIVDNGGVGSDGVRAFPALGESLRAEVETFAGSQVKEMQDFVRSGGFIAIGGSDSTEGNSSYKPLITPESCIDYGHAYAEHPTDWSGLAAQMYEDRGYIMTPYQLANLNSPLAEFTDTVLSSKLHLDGPACIALPAPQTWGVNITDGKKSVEAYNSSAIDTPEELVAWNPGIAIRNKAGKLDAAATLRQILPAGFVLKTKAKPSLSLFKQEMTQEYFDQVYKKDTALGRKIRAENDADVGIKKGALLNLPPKTTPYLKEHKMTPAGIATYYARSYDADNLGAQQLAGPVEIKLVDEKIAKTEHAVQAMTPDMNLQVLQLQSYAEVRVGHDVPAQWIRWAIESANKYNKNHPELTPAVLIAQMIRESNLTQNPLGGPNFAGAAGISQFLEPTFEEVARERHFPKGVTRYMPQWAIEAQAAYDLDMLVRTKPYVGRNSNIELALAAYNAGPGKVDQYHGMPPASEVGDYPSDILNHANAAMHGYGPLHLTHNNRQTTTGQTITDYVDNIVYWSQTDSRFNTFTVHAKDGNTNTMGWVGCGPTTAAMMASTLTGRQIDPIDMANYFMAKGFIVDNGGVGSDGVRAFPALGESLRAEVETFAGSQVKEMQDFVRSGGFIAIGGSDSTGSSPFTSEGHVIFIRKVAQDGSFMIGDPARYANSTRTWAASQIIPYGGYFIGLRMPDGKHKSLAVPK